MKLIRYRWTHPSLADVLRLYPLGDLHLGNAATNETALKATIAEIAADPLARWIGMGDYCEYIILHDPRFAPGSLATWIDVPALVDLPKAEEEHLLALLQPIAGQCLALLRGNHESAINQHTERDVYQNLVTALRNGSDRTLGLGLSGFIRLAIERTNQNHTGKGHSWALDIYAHHGAGGGELAGSKALRLERALMRYNADLILVGHWHHKTVITAQCVTLNRRGTNIVHHTRRAIATGHYLQSHVQDTETYVEAKMLPPSPIGTPVIELRPSDESIRVVV